MSYEIEKDVAPPSDRTTSGFYARYPFGKMEPGDSFVVLKQDAKRARSAAEKWKQRHPGWKYFTNTEGDSVRIWRDHDRTNIS